MELVITPKLSPRAIYVTKPVMFLKVSKLPPKTLLGNTVTSPSEVIGVNVSQQILLSLVDSDLVLHEPVASAPGCVHPVV